MWFRNEFSSLAKVSLYIAYLRQHCHNNSVTTVSQQHCHNNSVTTTLSQQQCHNSKFVIFQEELLMFLKCYNFLWVQWRHNCSPAASFVNCVMALHLLKVHLQTFLSLPVTQKCNILSCDTIVANERYVNLMLVWPCLLSMKWRVWPTKRNNYDLLIIY